MLAYNANMYTYCDLKNDIASLDSLGVKTGEIGSSVYGNKLYFAHMGAENGRQIIITGGIHARENVTCALVIKQAFSLIGRALSVGFYFLPMLNPDGALLIENGNIAPNFIKEINGGDDFSLWKANGRAVDLNLNFDAKFGKGKGNRFSPAPHGYVGERPFSEPETAALRDFTLKVKPVFTISYHALGREVYWYFGQERDDRAAAKAIADFLNYKLVDGDLGSAGGYKDWCVTVGIPAVTIEIGRDGLTHPLKESDVSEDIERNISLLDLLIKLFA